MIPAQLIQHAAIALLRMVARGPCLQRIIPSLAFQTQPPSISERFPPQPISAPTQQHVKKKKKKRITSPFYFNFISSLLFAFLKK